jgi:phosphoglycolate phosphatase
MALNHTLRTIGRPEVPLDQVSNLIGGGARMMLEKALAVTGGAGDYDIKALHRTLLAYYEDHIAVHTCLYPGAEAMLDDMDTRGVKLAVATNKSERLARHLLDTLGLTQHFVTIIGGDTLGPGRAKPEPDMVLEMINRLGGGRAAFVGDTTYDTRAASAAGIPCVGVSFGFLDVPLEQLGATATISHYDSLIPTLMQL